LPSFIDQKVQYRNGQTLDPVMIQLNVFYSLTLHLLHTEYINFIPIFISHVRGKVNACIGLLGKPKAKRPLGGPKRRWENNIKMDIHEAEWEGHGLDWSSSRWWQVAGSCKCGSELSGFI